MKRFANDEIAEWCKWHFCELGEIENIEPSSNIEVLRLRYLK